MELRRLLLPLVFVLSIAITALAHSNSSVANSTQRSNDMLGAYHPFELPLFFDPAGDDRWFEDSDTDLRGRVVKTPIDGGIRLDIPEKSTEKFENWKAELLSTDFGRQQWDQYANNKNFILTITISSKKGRGAGTDKYLWDDDGKLVGATITLGDNIEKGYPDPIYYPVMNSLSAEDTTYSISGRVLAATKLSHEIGHVNQTAKANRNNLLLQNKLMPEYTTIFLSNGRDSKDQKLVQLAQQMGGTPIEIWESREYWSEVNAMLYLKERISRENYYCFVFNKIKRNIEEYAKDYEKRFDQYSEFSSSPCWK